MKLNNLFYKSLKNKLKNYYHHSFSMCSYSQEGEDLILNRLFEGGQEKSTGFYIDIGAHHPFRFSNTYFFYRKGWSGINMDATPGSMKLFNKFRPRDINLEVAIFDEMLTLPYHIFREPALNTFSKELAVSYIAHGEILDKEILIPTFPLSQILEDHIAPSQAIDFMNIDVEGHDFQALKSNNWQKYQPKFLLIESLGVDLADILKSQLVTYLEDKNYQFIAKTINTLFFKFNN